MRDYAREGKKRERERATSPNSTGNPFARSYQYRIYNAQHLSHGFPSKGSGTCPYAQLALKYPTREHHTVPAGPSEEEDNGIIMMI